MSTIDANEIKRVKALGFLHNRGTDCFSVRIITENGVLNAAQVRNLSEVAEKFGNGKLTFTSRMTVELPGIPYEHIDDVIEYVKKEGMHTGGTGAKVRPIMACKGTVCRFGLQDTQDIAKEIHDRFFVGYQDVKLPHKFKIAVGGCPNNCVKPNLNDLGVIGQCIPQFEEELCKGCKKCAIQAECPVQAATVKDKKLVIDPDKCIHCGRCVGKCYFNSIKSGKKGFRIDIGGRWGKEVSHGKTLIDFVDSREEVMKIIEKTLQFFKEEGLPRERFAVTLDRVGMDYAIDKILS